MKTVSRKRAIAKPARSVSRKPSAAKKRTGSSRDQITARQVLPYFLSFCLVVCIGAIVALGYSSATASGFFKVVSVEVNGVERASKTEVESIVLSETERTGSWNADLDSIKARVEKLAFVRSASVSRVLPNGVRVAIIEKQPAALVDLPSGPTLVDENGAVIAASIKPEPELPFAITGWEEAKTLQAEKDNKQRVKLYQAMVSEWRRADLLGRVKSVNTKDLRELIVLSEDSGNRVAISVGRENFGENLKNGLMAITGKGETFEGVTLSGSNMRLMPRVSK
jgi:cell division septal protein FtsQ